MRIFVSLLFAVGVFVPVLSAHGEGQAARKPDPARSIPDKDHLSVLCIPRGSNPPEGFEAVALYSAEGDVVTPHCSCPTASVFTNIASILTMGAAYKAIRFTNETTRKEIAKDLNQLLLPKKVVAKAAPTIHKVVTSKVVKKGTVAVFAVAAVFAIQDAIEIATHEKLEARYAENKFPLQSRSGTDGRTPSEADGPDIGAIEKYKNKKLLSSLGCKVEEVTVTIVPK